MYPDYMKRWENVIRPRLPKDIAESYDAAIREAYGTKYDDRAAQALIAEAISVASLMIAATTEQTRDAAASALDAAIAKASADHVGDEATEAPDHVRDAESALYDHLDRYGATKRVTYLISALIDAKIADMNRGKRYGLANP